MSRLSPLPLLLVAALTPTLHATEPVNFSRDVLPILADNCFGCHGPDEQDRKADLRLDVRESAVEVRDGIAAVVPGKPAQSDLLARVISDDPDDLMPPPKSHKKKLEAKQADILRRWIEAGAPWGRHWAFEKPVRSEGPAGAAHPVDAFVRARLSQEGITPSPTAEKHTLARRVSFDLTGLPPTRDELQEFLEDQSPDAYAKLVNRLLTSPHFGERMAMWWLDAARYSDTDGFQADETRTNWPWRDWVVEAFNRNMPFDQFTIEQFAGDLLPDATPEQKLATCFHRNHMTNGEGGRDKEESRVDYVIDRVNTTGTLWLGLTVGCAQCHTHKFDPISHRDYYSLSAFFNSIDEDGAAGKAAKPYLTYASPHAERAIAEAQALVNERKPIEAKARAAAETPFVEWLGARAAEVRDGFTAWLPLKATELQAIEGTELRQEGDGTVQALGPNPKQDDYILIAPAGLPRVTGLRLEVFPHEAHTQGRYSRGGSGHFTLTDIKVQVRRKGSSQLRDISVSGAVADVEDDPKKHNGYGQVKHVLDDDPRNGWSTRDHDPNETRTAVFAFADPLLLAADEELIVELRHRSTLGDANIGRFRISVTDQRGPAVTGIGPAPLEELAAAQLEDLGKLDAKLRKRLFDQFLSDYAPYMEARSSLNRAERQLAEAKAAKKTEVQVLTEREEPRETFILVRGVWDKHGEKVGNDIPAEIAMWPGDEPRTRLGLGKWIVSRENPLTARVAVNHLWQLCFGSGIVRTPDDFGLQGERPTHPELLDWLAVEFMDSGWDVKHVLRLIVTSDTYRQSSHVPAELLARDPENRLLARGSRFRLPSWMLRDAALQAAGLLNPAIGGPPVRPYQPPGVWEENFMGRFKYEPSEGAAQHRRTLYAFWRRASAPTFLFDSAQRRVCEVRTPRTNTPLQALTLMNDESYLEAARTLAENALRAGRGQDGRMQNVARRVLSRDLAAGEVVVLSQELERALDYYREHHGDAAKLLKVGQRPPDPAFDPAELAAHMLLASTLLNLDEAITHE
jgi:hypothetical protein